MRYDRGNRPVIAPFGFRVFDAGDQSWLFPTVSDKQKYGKPFRVELLHAGKAGGRLLDLEDLYAEHPDVLIPDNLVSSARNELGTPYWFTARKHGISLTEGGTVDLGVIKLKIHGVHRRPRGHRRRRAAGLGAARTAPAGARPASATAGRGRRCGPRRR